MEEKKIYQWYAVGIQGMIVVAYPTEEAAQNVVRQEKKSFPDDKEIGESVYIVPIEVIMSEPARTTLG